MNPRILLLAACAIAAVVIFHRLGDAPLGGDDCYYSQVAKEMSGSGDLLTPRNGGRPDFHTSKPPMLYWMNIASGRLFGFTTAAMRLPSAVLGFAGVVACAFFAARYISPLAGFFAAIILTFTQQYLYHARSAVTDGPFAVFFMLAFLSFWIARTEKNALWYYAFGLFAGCAVMTRQIPGFFILCAVGAYIVLSREWDIVRAPHAWGGMALMAAVILPWHLSMYHRYGHDFLSSYFGVTLMTGIKGYPAGYSSSPSLNPWHAYLDILFSNYWPWLPFLGYGLYRFFRDRHDDRFKLFMLCWAIVPFAIFQAAKVKQFHYIVPLYPAFALIVASVLDSWRPAARRTAASVLLGITAALAVAYLVYPIIPRTLDSREFIDTITLAPAARASFGDINVVEDGFCHYNNCLMFYADKRVVKNTESAVVEKFNGRSRVTFALPQNVFSSLVPLFDAKKIRIIKKSNTSVLFDNALQE